MLAKIPECSPRKRGWSFRELISWAKSLVLPAQAGMVLEALLDLVKQFQCSPRKRGWSDDGRAPRGV